jgi:hypothetical protein
MNAASVLDEEIWDRLVGLIKAAHEMNAEVFRALVSTLWQKDIYRRMLSLSEEGSGFAARLPEGAVGACGPPADVRSGLPPGDRDPRQGGAVTPRTRCHR